MLYAGRLLESTEGRRRASVLKRQRRCSSVLVGFVVPKPLSPKHKSTFLPRQHAATLIISVDWGLVSKPAFRFCYSTHWQNPRCIELTTPRLGYSDKAPGKFQRLIHHCPSDRIRKHNIVYVVRVERSIRNRTQAITNPHTLNSLSPFRLVYKGMTDFNISSHREHDRIITVIVSQITLIQMVNYLLSVPLREESGCPDT